MNTFRPISYYASMGPTLQCNLEYNVVRIIINLTRKLISIGCSLYCKYIIAMAALKTVLVATEQAVNTLICL